MLRLCLLLGVSDAFEASVQLGKRSCMEGSDGISGTVFFTCPCQNVAVAKLRLFLLTEKLTTWPDKLGIQRQGEGEREMRGLAGILEKHQVARFKM